MSKKYNHTLIAAFVLIGLLGAFILFSRYKRAEPAKLATKPEEKLLALDAARVKSFTLKPRDGEAVTCAKEGDMWAIVEPKKLQADKTAVSTLLDTLADATVDEVVEQNARNLKDFGLDPPAETLEVETDAKPAKVELKLGDETPTSSGLYAQLAGSPRVVTLASYMKASLEKSLFDLRDRRAVTLDADQIQKIQVESKGKRTTLSKNPEGVWELVLPPAVRADKFGAENMVDRLRGLQMQSVVREDKKDASKYGFTQPTLRVELAGPKGSQTLVVGKKDGERYDAMNSALEPVFTLNSDFLADFQKDPSDLREKDLFSISSFDVKHFELTTPRGRRVFEKQNDKWKQTSPGLKDEPAAKVEALLDHLRDLRATSFPQSSDLASCGLTKPAYQFEVGLGERKELVEVGKVGQKIYARRSTDPLPCQLDKSALDEVEKALQDLPP